MGRIRGVVMEWVECGGWNKWEGKWGKEVMLGDGWKVVDGMG